MWRAVYCFGLKMSESNAQVLVDMLFADETLKAGIEYDYSKRPTYPLFKHLVSPTGVWDRDGVYALLEANARYEILGDDGGYRAMFNPHGDHNAAEAALGTFKKQYGRTFAVDWQWIGGNFDDMLARNKVFYQWSAMIGPQRYDAARLTTLKECVESLPEDWARNADGKGISVDELYKALVPGLITPVLDAMYCEGIPPKIGDVTGAGFRRWALGQSLLFAVYDFHPSVRGRSRSFIEMLDVSDEDLAGRISAIRYAFEDSLRTLREAKLITEDDYNTLRVNVPFFDPRFMYNKSLGKPVEDIRQAAEIYGSVGPV